MRKSTTGVIVVLVVAVVVGVVSWFVGSLVPPVVYQYRVELQTPGGPLPFHLSYHRDGIRRPWEAVVQNGGWMNVYDRISVDMNSKSPTRFEIPFPYYDSALHFRPDEDGYNLVGEWVKKRGGAEPAVVSLIAIRSNYDLFDPVNDAGDPAEYSGRWSVDFESSEDLAIGVFEVDDNQLATGTFLTTTGDYRYLAGRVDGDLMRLSTFDGAHAFLFHARMLDDGTIRGDFWSGNWHHETWTAVRDDDAHLPDAFKETSITDESKLDEMVFKDLEGVPTRVLDLLDASNAKARVIEVFGTWCPNCADAGRELVELKSMYGDDLAVVGLAFEITEDFERSVTQVKRYEARMGSDWPILIGGLNDKELASKALPVLDRVRSYPTLIFLNDHNEVEAINTGFSGPATGDAYTEQRERFESIIEKLIEE